MVSAVKGTLSMHRWYIYVVYECAEGPHVAREGVRFTLLDFNLEKKKSSTTGFHVLATHWLRRKEQDRERTGQSHFKVHNFAGSLAVSELLNV